MGAGPFSPTISSPSSMKMALCSRMYLKASARLHGRRDAAGFGGLIELGDQPGPLAGDGGNGLEALVAKFLHSWRSCHPPMETLKPAAAKARRISSSRSSDGGANMRKQSSWPRLRYFSCPPLWYLRRSTRRTVFRAGFRKSIAALMLASSSLTPAARGECGHGRACPSPARSTQVLEDPQVGDACVFFMAALVHDLQVVEDEVGGRGQPIAQGVPGRHPGRVQGRMESAGFHGGPGRNSGWAQGLAAGERDAALRMFS